MSQETGARQGSSWTRAKERALALHGTLEFAPKRASKVLVGQIRELPPLVTTGSSKIRPMAQRVPLLQRCPKKRGRRAGLRADAPGREEVARQARSAERRARIAMELEARRDMVGELQEGRWWSSVGGTREDKERQ